MLFLELCRDKDSIPTAQCASFAIGDTPYADESGHWGESYVSWGLEYAAEELIVALWEYKCDAGAAEYVSAKSRPYERLTKST